MTGAGTWIEVSATWKPPVVKVSPEWQSSPKMATMSPGPASWTSSISSACRRTSRPTFVVLPVRVLVIIVSRVSLPW